MQKDRQGDNSYSTLKDRQGDNSHSTLKDKQGNEGGRNIGDLAHSPELSAQRLTNG